MNKKLIIGAVVAVVAIAGVAFVVTRKDDSTGGSNATSNGTTNQPAQSAGEGASESGNIYSLTDAGKARKCTFQYSGSNGTGSGTMYTDGKGRGLMTVDVKTERGNTGTSNTLVLSDKVYGWTTTGGSAIGFMYNKASLTGGSGASGANGSSAADPNQKFDLQCGSWNVDEAVLGVPQGVNFMSLPTAQ